MWFMDSGKLTALLPLDLRTFFEAVSMAYDTVHASDLLGHGYPGDTKHGPPVPGNWHGCIVVAPHASSDAYHLQLPIPFGASGNFWSRSRNLWRTKFGFNS